MSSFWARFRSKPKNKFTLPHLKQLWATLSRNPTVTERNQRVIVETLRQLAELLIWGDQHNPEFFDFFLEKEVLAYFLSVLRQKTPNVAQVQLLQTLSILIENIRSEIAIFYLLSNNHINNIIRHQFDFSDEEILSYYISFLKTLSLKLNNKTVQFFFNEAENDFPLYTEAVKFFNNPESMVRVAVRTLTLSVFRLDEPGVRRFIIDRKAAPYFTNLVWFLSDQCHTLNDLIVMAPQHKVSRRRLDDCVDELVDLFYYIHDIFALGIQGLNEVLCDNLLLHLFLPLCADSLLPQRDTDAISRVYGPTREEDARLFPLVALVLLAQVVYIMRYPRFINTLGRILFTPCLPSSPWVPIADLLADPPPVPASHSRHASIDWSHSSLDDLSAVSRGDAAAAAAPAASPQKSEESTPSEGAAAPTSVEDTEGGADGEEGGDEQVNGDVDDSPVIGSTSPRDGDSDTESGSATATTTAAAATTTSPSDTFSLANTDVDAAVAVADGDTAVGDDVVDSKEEEEEVGEEEELQQVDKSDVKLDNNGKGDVDSEAVPLQDLRRESASGSASASPASSPRLHGKTSSEMTLCKLLSRYPPNTNPYRAAFIAMWSSQDDSIVLAACSVLYAFIGNPSTHKSVLAESQLMPFRHVRAKSLLNDLIGSPSASSPKAPGGSQLKKKKDPLKALVGDAVEDATEDSIFDDSSSASAEGDDTMDSSRGVAAVVDDARADADSGSADGCQGAGPNASPSQRDEVLACLLDTLVDAQRFRLLTLQVSVMLMKQLVYSPNAPSQLSREQLRLVEVAYMRTVEAVRRLTEGTMGHLLLSLFEDELCKHRQVNFDRMVTHSTMLLASAAGGAASIPLPGEKAAQARHAIQRFLVLRELRYTLLQRKDTLLPLSQGKLSLPQAGRPYEVSEETQANHSQLVCHCTLLSSSTGAMASSPHRSPGRRAAGPPHASAPSSPASAGSPPSDLTMLALESTFLVLLSEVPEGSWLGTVVHAQPMEYMECRLVGAPADEAVDVELFCPITSWSGTLRFDSPIQATTMKVVIEEIRLRLRDAKMQQLSDVLAHESFSLSQSVGSDADSGNAEEGKEAMAEDGKADVVRTPSDGEEDAEGGS